MPLAAPIAASLSAGLATRARSLWVGEVDVLLRPGAAGNDYGVLEETVRLTEGGPGTVSALSFTVEDPKLQLTFAEGQIVRLHNHTHGIPEFLGFIQSWNIKPDSVNRVIDVIAQGVEAILDWLQIPALSLPSGMLLSDAVQSAYANSVGTSGIGLRALSGGGQSSQAQPIDSQWLNGLQYAVTLTNVSLRQGLAAIAAAAVPTDPAFAGYFLETTIDFYGGLRVWTSLNNIGGPVDYTTVGTGAPDRHADLQFATDAGGAIHNVLVIGGNAAGSGLVTDGSGLPGKTGQTSDPTCLTAAQRQAVGRTYLQDKSLAFRGSVLLEDPNFEAVLVAGSVEVHAGGQIQLDDTQAGLVGNVQRITGIEKRLLPAGKAYWTIRFGGNPPRATDQIRRFTHSVFR